MLKRIFTRRRTLAFLAMTLFAGGGFRHGQHLSLDPEGGAYPLPNLFVSMLQRMGFEDDKFASSTGTMRGLEAKGTV